MRAWPHALRPTPAAGAGPARVAERRPRRARASVPQRQSTTPKPVLADQRVVDADRVALLASRSARRRSWRRGGCRGSGSSRHAGGRRERSAPRRAARCCRGRRWFPTPTLLTKYSRPVTSSEALSPSVRRSAEQRLRRDAVVVVAVGRRGAVRRADGGVADAAERGALEREVLASATRCRWCRARGPVVETRKVCGEM